MREFRKESGKLDVVVQTYDSFTWEVAPQRGERAAKTAGGDWRAA